MGPVRLERLNLENHPHILSSKSKEELERKIFKAWAKEAQPSQPTLCSRFMNCNLVYYREKYYAIPISSGEVKLETVADNSPFLSSTSLEELIDMIIEKECNDRTSSHPPALVTCHDDYNVVHYAGTFFAIPQSMGSVHIDKIDVSRHRTIITSTSLAELRNKVDKIKRLGPFGRWLAK